MSTVAKAFGDELEVGGQAESERGAEAVVPAAAAKKSSRSLRIVGVFAILGAVVGGYTWHVRGLESTDDAQVDADVVSVPAKTGGSVARIAFTDNQHVKAGDLLVELDGDAPRARLAQADASVAAAEANAAAADADSRVAETNARANARAAAAGLHGAGSSASASSEQIQEAAAAAASARANRDKARLDLDRTKQLLATGAIAQAQLDQAQTSFDADTAALAQAEAHVTTIRSMASQAVSRVEEASARFDQSRDVDTLIAQAQARAAAARAQVATARAARDLAALDVKYTQIFAPSDGLVSKRAVAIGQMISPGQPVVQLVPDGVLWITANFKETQINRMQVGQPVKFEVDAFPGREFHGVVESFSAATGSKFTLLPPDNATGNFTKVVQRVPVRVRVTEVPAGVSLRPGLSAEITVDTKG